MEDFEDYEELTPEEIERERVARKRRREARERRRRQRKRQAIIRCSILILIVILIIVGFVKLLSGIWKHFHNSDKRNSTATETIVPTTEEATTEAPKPEIDESILAKPLPEDRQAALAILKEQAETDSDIHAIYENAAVYPDKILQCLAINSEMKQFVLDYPAQISVVFEGDFEVDVPVSEVPLFLQYDEQWGYADYGTTLLAINGSGPACLSMAYTYLQQDGYLNPIRIADFSMEQGYLGENNETFWKLMTEGASSLGLISNELSTSKEDMISALEDGKLIICSMDPGDFTKTGQYILIRSYENGLFYVNDPNSEARSNVGWDYERLSSQISNMWAIEKGTGYSHGDSESDNEDGDYDNTDDSDNNTDTGDGTDQTDDNN